jgi:catecholate siderophore receptor
VGPHAGLSLTTAVFDLERESYTSVDPLDPEQVVVIEGSNTRGFEVQLSGSLTDRWTLMSGYSYLDGEIKRADGSGNRRQPHAADAGEHALTVDALQRQRRPQPGRWAATYQDSFFVQEDNAVEVPATRASTRRCTTPCRRARGCS